MASRMATASLCREKKSCLRRRVSGSRKFSTKRVCTTSRPDRSLRFRSRFVTDAVKDMGRLSQEASGWRRYRCRPSMLRCEGARLMASAFLSRIMFGIILAGTLISAGAFKNLGSNVLVASVLPRPWAPSAHSESYPASHRSRPLFAICSHPFLLRERHEIGVSPQIIPNGRTLTPVARSQ